MSTEQAGTHPGLARPTSRWWSWLLWLLVGAALASPWVLSAGGSNAPVLWWASRAFGFVSYVALWVAMLTGVLLGARGVDQAVDPRVLLAMHEEWTLAGVAATAAHVLAVVMNEHAGIGLLGSLVPFASSSMTTAVGVGVVAFWASGMLAVSSWLRTRLSYAAWRAIHALAFGAFVLALVHSVAAGTDSGAPLAQWLYVASGSLLAGAIVIRLLTAMTGRPRRTAKPAGRAD